MKIVAFNGSPRAERSNTHVMVEAFLAGAQGAGAEVENVFLAQKRLGYCLGCFSCWSKTPGVCIQADGMEELLEKYLSADVAVFATPLHNDNVSALTKNFIDRLLPAGDPHFERDEEGEVRHVRGARPAPKFVMIANCGFPEQSHFQVLRLLTRRMARNYHTEFVGEIYRGMGSLLQEEELRPLVDAYRDLLGKAGAEIAINGRISPETGQRLEEPLIPAPDYVDIFLSNVNAYMEEGIAANRKA